MKFKYKNKKDYQNKVSEYSKKSGKVCVTSSVFDTVFVKTFDYPSQVSSFDVEQCSEKGYWKNGKFYVFSEDFVTKKTNPTDYNKKRKVRRGGYFGG